MRQLVAWADDGALNRRLAVHLVSRHPDAWCLDTATNWDLLDIAQHWVLDVIVLQPEDPIEPAAPDWALGLPAVPVGSVHSRLRLRLSTLARDLARRRGRRRVSYRINRLESPFFDRTLRIAVALRVRQPKARLVLCTAHPVGVFATHELAVFDDFLPKPVQDERVASLLGRPARPVIPRVVWAEDEGVLRALIGRMAEVALRATCEALETNWQVLEAVRRSAPQVVVLQPEDPSNVPAPAALDMLPAVRLGSRLERALDRVELELRNRILAPLRIARRGQADRRQHAWLDRALRIAAEVRRLQPGARLVLCTGHSEGAFTREELAMFDAFLAKPFTAEAVGVACGLDVVPVEARRRPGP